MTSVRLSNLAEVNPPSRRFEELPADGAVSFLPMEGVWPDALELDERTKADVEVGYTRFEEGDLLVPKIAPTFGHARSAIASGLRDGVGAGTTELHVLRARRNVSSRWLFYITKSAPFLQEGESTMYGVAGQKRIALEWLRNYHVDAIEYDEQIRVASALDTLLRHVDSLIDEQVQFSGLLLERRRSAVFDAVTGQSLAGERRGDVPWVQSVPARWDVRKLLRVARLGSGHTPARNRPDLWEDCTIPWITTGEVWQIRSDLQEVITETREMISEAGVAESAAVVHPQGTVVLCRTAASAGYSALMGGDMATSQDFATWTCGPDLDPYFLLYCLRAMRRDLLGRLALGSTHRTIYMPEIRSIVVPVPKIEEQREIVACLKDELQRIDNIRDEIDQQVALLREHRLALITSAVSESCGSEVEVA